MEPEEILDITEDTSRTDETAKEESVSQALGKPLIFTAVFIALVVMVIIAGMIIAARPENSQTETGSLLTEAEVVEYRERLLQDVEVVAVTSNTVTVQDFSDDDPIAPMSESELAALERDNYASLPTTSAPTPPVVEEVEVVEGQVVESGSVVPVSGDAITPMTDEELAAFLSQQGATGPGSTQEGVHSTTGDVDGAIVNPYVVNGLQEASITGTVLSIVEAEGHFIVRDDSTNNTHSVVVDTDTRFYVGGSQASFAALSTTDSVVVEGEMYAGDTILYADVVTITGTQEVIFVSP